MTMPQPAPRRIPEALLTPAGLCLLGVVVLGAALGLGFLGSLLRGRKGDVVFVRTSEVMARYKGALQARSAFQKDTAAWAEESRQLEGRLKELAKSAKPSDPKASEEGRELASRLKALRDKGAARDQELMTPVLAEVNAGIKKFAQRHGYRMIMGTLQGGVILHGSEDLDVTEALLQELNQ